MVVIGKNKLEEYKERFVSFIKDNCGKIRIINLPDFLSNFVVIDLLSDNNLQFASNGVIKANHIVVTMKIQEVQNNKLIVKSFKVSADENETGKERSVILWGINRFDGVGIDNFEVVTQLGKYEFEQL